MNQPIKVYIRWMVRRDLNAVANMWGGDDWTAADYMDALRRRDSIALVALLNDDDEPLVGVIVYRLRKYRLIVQRLLVDSRCRRYGVASQLISKLKTKLARHRREQIDYAVDDNDLATHLFLRSQGFRAVRVERGRDGDWYHFRYEVNREANEIKTQDRFASRHR